MRFFVIASLLFFCTLAPSVRAQNFQPFKNKYKYQFSYTGYFQNFIQSGLIHCIEVDSAVLVGSDSVFHFNKLDAGYMSNFWGDSMVKKPNGDYLFIIKTDTVLVKTQLALGSQWTFKLNNVLYTVTYDHYNPETVLTNHTDLVQTYIVENASGFKDSIKLSENFGLIYSFPFSDNSYNPHSHFNLTYIFNSKLGENKINYFEYFNYELGDILEYTPDYRVAIGYPGRIGVDIYKVISKTVSLNNDTVTYLFSQCHVDAVNSGIYSATKTYCKMVVTDWSVLGNFPHIDILSFPTNKTYFVFAANIEGMSIGTHHPFEYDQYFTFEIGLGLKKYTRGGGFDYDYIYYENIKYIKQFNTDDNCDGIETILDTKSLHASSANLIVAPNPFDNTISLNAIDLIQGNWTVRITSALGVEVYTSKMVISSSDQKIDLSNLPALTAGIYFLSIENESQVYSKKIVKQ
ncbi:T9SS type A sorting domain-containing protein [Cytophaga aurantiaca]|uniref:T9SS type A sorting domain-containing protein n=1 Tax=Cytophaga aurantiaca TaxID=29530 RepID=UPI00037F827B|nr:T9SS type A sorting domain-containing protein [Cytophaga aurantiaca]